MILFLLTAITLNPCKRIPIKLSSTDMNRIAVKNGRITAIYGAAVFMTEIDHNLGQLFLHVKQDIVLPDRLAMAITTEDGMTQDLSVTFEEGIIRPVIFELSEQQISLRQKAQEFFQQVLSGKEDQFVTQTKGGTSQEFDFGKLVFKRRVMTNGFCVDFYNLISKHKRYTYNITHQYFKTPVVIGVWLSAERLEPGKTIEVALLKRRL